MIRHGHDRLTQLRLHRHHPKVHRPRHTRKHTIINLPVLLARHHSQADQQWGKFASTIYSLLHCND
jgi:hypothetical protein